MIELGIGMFGDLNYQADTNTYQKSSERLKEIIEEVKLADELGIDRFAMGEHHRQDYAVPSPETLLAALAVTTKRIKLSSGVNVISSADPVKLYQDYTMIDMLSNQRAEIMAGRGSFIESFPVFGYPLHHYNELFEEKLGLLLTLREKDEVTWSGQFRAPLHQQTIYPKAERKIPISIAVGGTPQSVLRAAHLGLPIVFAIIGGNPEQFKPLVDYYRQAYLQAGHDSSRMMVSVHSHTFVTIDTPTLLREYYPCYSFAMNKIGKERGWGSSYTPENFKAGTLPQGALYMGDAEYVAEKIIRTIELFSLQQFIAHVDVGGPSHALMMKNIELLGTEVFPRVRKHFQAQNTL